MQTQCTPKRQQLTGDGVLSYRTKLSRNEAWIKSFHACLHANSRFEAVEIVTVHPKANAKKAEAMKIGWYITFRPTNAQRQEEMRQREGDERTLRGYGEGMDYMFLLSDTGRFWWCYNPISQETYEVCRWECSCPDYHYRCRQLRIQCKHQKALEAQAKAGILGRYEEKAA